MGFDFRRRNRRVLVILALILLAGWLLPSFFSAEHYHARLEAGLERALHRPVYFRALSFHLLPRPGFSIEDAVVREDPAFGSEAFAHIDRIECDLRWRSLWRPRVEFAKLRLERASFNLVRNAQGQWNVENLVRESGVASPPLTPAGQMAHPSAGLVVEAENARINFVAGANKKSFAITGLRAHLEFDPVRSLLRYRLAGNPIRTDLALPSPGALELEGEWTPGKDLEGPLNATLRSSATLLYDWVPLVTGHNPGLYGVLDGELHLAGSVRLIKVDGQMRVAQLHRWEQIPPSDSAPITFYFRGTFDRNRGRILLESLDASFAESRLHLSGSLEKIPAPPELDLVVALERSRIEDLLALSRSFGAKPSAFGVSGRVDGLLAVQGPWAKRRYGGFISARDVRLRAPAGVFSVSPVAVRIDKTGARLEPTRITLAPHVELVAEGMLERLGRRYMPLRGPGTARYDLTLSAKAIPLRDFARFARAVGVRAAQNIDVQGVGTATFHLAGPAWPPSGPTFTGRAELRAARLLVPGFTEPLNIPSARVEVKDDRIVVDRVVAVIGTSVFSGRLQHRGDQAQPWEFNLRAKTLSLEQGAQWFDVLGLRKPLPLPGELPGLRNSADRRFVASNLFSHLNAKGRFSTPAVSYRALTLRDFQASVEISGRVIRVSRATFKAAGGQGQGQAQVNLTGAPPLVTVDLRLADADLQSLAPRLPLVLERLRGSCWGTGHFETRGLTHKEMSDNLHGQASVRLKNISLGDFDPLAVMARASGWGFLEPARGELSVRALAATLRVHDRTVSLEDSSFDLAGAKLKLAGTYSFDGGVELDVAADLGHVKRRWLNSENAINSGTPPMSSMGSLHLTGRMDRLMVAKEAQLSRAMR